MPLMEILAALTAERRARQKKNAPRPDLSTLPEWRQRQLLAPVAKPGPARPPRSTQARSDAELRARRLSTRSSRRRAARRAER